MFDYLLKVARAVLEGVLQEITRQINIVQQQVIEELKNYVSRGFDDIWQGDDALQFKDKVMKRAIPGAEQIVGITTNTHSGIIRAAEVIQNADRQATQMVGDLNNTFSQI